MFAQTEEFKPSKKHFVGVMQTSDVLGSPDKKIGSFNVFSNGGRLQPGCYTNENSIQQCMELSRKLVHLIYFNF